MDKIAISKQIKNYDRETIDSDLYKLIKILPPTKKDFTKRSGNKYLDYYFFPYRLNTITKRNVSYYDFIEDDNLFNKPYVKKMVKYHTDKGRSRENGLYYAFQLYYGSVDSFKPIIASYVYGVFNPTSVLDFSAGWGGRLLGAVLYPKIRYTGFDTNTELETPYRELINDLGVKDRTEIIFEDSSKVDYSKYDYDMVFTSPPYYTLEKYQNMPHYNNYQDWIETFLKPVITNTYKHMKKGNYILNIPKAIYHDVVKILGKETSSFPLSMSDRRATKVNQREYSEEIYIWNKV